MQRARAVFASWLGVFQGAGINRRKVGHSQPDKFLLGSSMPRRSNDFQRLVYLVRLNLADGATVVESKLMRDRITKSYREVDVVIKGHVGSQPVVVSIECRDHKRVADVGWIDAMKAKHDRLETNALLLASSAGFTKEATEVAKKYGIETFTLENQDSANLPSLIGPEGTLWHRACKFSASKVRVAVAQTADLPPETVVCNPENLVFLEDGSELCQVDEIVSTMMTSDEVHSFLLREGREEHAFFELTWESPRDSLDRSFYMQKIEPPALRLVESINVVGPCKIEVGAFCMRRSRLGSISVEWGKSTLSGLDAMAVATVTPEGKTRISINVKGRPEAAI